MPKLILSRLFLLAAMTPMSFVSSAAQTASQEMPPETKAPAPSIPKLTITYDGKIATWTPQSIAQLDHTAIDVFNAHTKAKEHYAGVPLTVLLTKIGVPTSPHGKDFRIYIVAEGADGYQVVYSLGEVTPDVHEGTVIVADTLGVENLSTSGPFQLVATGEKRPARWVRNLVAIRVLTAP